MEVVTVMAPTSIIFTSHQAGHHIYHIFNVYYLILLCLEDSGLILMDNLLTVTATITMILSAVLNLIILLTSLYINLINKYLMNIIQMGMTMSSNVVYPVVVLILLPTSSLFIYLVSYISLY